MEVKNLLCCLSLLTLCVATAIAQEPLCLQGGDNCNLEDVLNKAYMNGQYYCCRYGQAMTSISQPEGISCTCHGRKLTIEEIRQQKKDIEDSLKEALQDLFNIFGK